MQIYHQAFMVGESIRNMEAPLQQKDAVITLWDARWEQMHTPLQAFGYAVDPEFIDHDLGGNAEVCSWSFSAPLSLAVSLC